MPDVLLLLPDFLLILCGFLLCRFSGLDRPVWEAAERLVYYLLFPVLLFARLSWCLQSALFPLNGKLEFSKAAFEAITITGHYLWLLAAAFTYLSPAKVRGTWLAAWRSKAV
jgi:predicted permease